jgi:hypothetical protein
MFIANVNSRTKVRICQLEYGLKIRAKVQVLTNGGKPISSMGNMFEIKRGAAALRPYRSRFDF